MEGWKSDGESVEGMDMVETETPRLMEVDGEGN